MELALHHVSIPTQDLERSAVFYETVLGLKRIPRPPFPISGIWYGIGRNHIHVTVYPQGSIRPSRRVDANDVHFALRADDFEKACAHLQNLGFDDGFAEDHPKKMILKRTGAAGFPQLFIMDPDFHTIEINQAAFYEGGQS